MASTKEKFTSDGRRFYEVEVRRGRSKSRITRRWYPKPTWCQKTIDKELDKYVAELERQVAEGQIISGKEKQALKEAEEAEKAKLKTVRSYTEGIYMPMKKESFAENSRYSYQSNIDHHILPVIGDMLLVEVTPAILTKLLIEFRATHAHSSAVKLYNILNGIFEMAFMDDSIPTNPMLKVERPKPKKGDEGVDEADKALKVDGLNYVLECVKQEPLHWQVFMHFAADSGARRGEICGLQWNDFDFKAGTVTFKRSLQYTPDKGVYSTSPKNGKARTIDVDRDVLIMFRRLQQEQAKSCFSKWVFTQDGTMDPMHPQTPTRYFTKFAKKYNIPGFHPHMLRHTNASVSITHGADVTSVSARLGHSDSAVTLRMYAHANEESIRRAGQTFRDALKAGSDEEKPDQKTGT